MSNNTGTVKGQKTFDLETSAEIAYEMGLLIENEKNKVKTQPLKLYFAGPWFDPKMATLYDGFEAIAQTVTNQGRCIYDIFWPRRQSSAQPSAVFFNNVAHLTNSDAIIASISRKDSGTAFEIGMAKALNKPVYLLGYDESDLLSHTNVMLAFSGRFLTMDKFADFLAGTIKKEDFITVPDTWEGKE